MLKNIIFDIGNVLIEFDRKYLVGNFYQGPDFDFLVKEIFKEWHKLDTGEIELDELIANVKKNVPKKYHYVVEGVLSHWEDYVWYTNAMLEFVKELKSKGYKLYILSNMPKRFLTFKSMFPFFQYFDGEVYSAPIKMVKPNYDIYDYLLKTYNLDPKECLFIDDNQENIYGSKNAGIDAFLFKNNLFDLKKYIENWNK